MIFFKTKAAISGSGLDLASFDASFIVCSYFRCCWIHERSNINWLQSCVNQYLFTGDNYQDASDRQTVYTMHAAIDTIANNTIAYTTLSLTSLKHKLIKSTLICQLSYYCTRYSTVWAMHNTISLYSIHGQYASLVDHGAPWWNYWGQIGIYCEYSTMSVVNVATEPAIHSWNKVFL